MQKICPYCGYGRNMPWVHACQHCGRTFRRSGKAARVAGWLVVLALLGCVYIGARWAWHSGLPQRARVVVSEMWKSGTSKASSAWSFVLKRGADGVRFAAGLFSRSAAIPAQAVAAVNEPVPAPAARKTSLAGMVLVSSGSFLMGSPSGIGEGDERPQRRVFLDSYYMDANDVTAAQYAKCVDAGACKRPQALAGCNFGDPEKSSHPVNCVTWEMARNYCSWAGKSLPTEAQWEKAARAGGVAKFSFGDDENAIGAYAWYDRNSDDHTHPAGAKKPNALGIYDMQGQVWQWVLDWYSPDYSGLHHKNPVRERTERYKVLRGGSAIDVPDTCRNANRFRQLPDKTSKVTGFRCASSAE